MKSIVDVLKAVDAFKKDMEELGVQIYVGVKEVEPSTGPKVRGMLCLLVREDLEAEGLDIKGEKVNDLGL